jgi:hypothetical protein
MPEINHDGAAFGLPERKKSGSICIISIVLM